MIFENSSPKGSFGPNMSDSPNWSLTASSRSLQAAAPKILQCSRIHSEDCIAKLCDILDSDLQVQPTIENAHRIGAPKSDGSPRPILAKFLYRPEQFRITDQEEERSER